MRPVNTDNSRRWAAGLALAIGLTGGLLYIAVWWQNRSLFIDEANLARNIAEKSLSALLDGLDYDQYAPPLFLLIEKVSFLLFGPSERSLRLFPLLAGLLALFLLGKTGRSLLPSPWPALFPLWLLAFSPDFLRYTTEVKQYSTDLAVALGILYTAWRRPPGMGNRTQTLAWGIAGAAAVWLSMPSVFALAGAGLYGWRCAGGGLPNPRLLLIPGMWLVSFGLYYFLFLQTDLGREQLLTYHRSYFLPFPPNSETEWAQTARIFRSILRTAFGYTAVALIAGGLFTLLGAGYLFRKDRPLLLLLTAPLLACWSASAAGLYSLMPRLTLFFIPLLWLLAAFGIYALWQAGRWWKGLALITLGAMLPLQDGNRYFFTRFQVEEIKPVLHYLDDHFREGDRIYVQRETVPAFRYYTGYHPLRETLSFPTSAVQTGEWEERPDLFGTTAPAHCRWLIFSHLISEESRQEESRLLAIAQEGGYTVRDTFRVTGAACYCFTKEEEGQKRRD